ncbi:thioredoxin-related protein [Catalinimonas alkaloidigena]|uniref:thioredoxin family protein n=1 Tax=Catalinimonas alkaloidigena TaxID=1075417 RepID=UPI00240594D7|nr:thioredoxin family protein [Catalinimonas alkaloidigena]MDF9798542.1 thioredoxin-related protein [Catalinimonas alkaloidigena]
MNKLMLSVLSLGLLFLVSSFTEPPKESKPTKGINWVTIEEAQELSKENPKKVIMDVYTDWCGWCKKMDKTTFADEKVVEYVNENFYAVKFDAEANKSFAFKGQEFTNPQFTKALRVSGYPTVVFFAEDFSKFQPVSGYRQADEFLKMLESFNQAEPAGK